MVSKYSILAIFVIVSVFQTSAVEFEDSDSYEDDNGDDEFDWLIPEAIQKLNPKLPRESAYTSYEQFDLYKYKLNPSRLAEIRSELLYPFYDQGGESGDGDYQNHIKDNSPQITKHLNFNLPTFGFGYNYTWVTLHGFLAFSHGSPLSPTYPLLFPELDYPEVNDPSFIGPFYSKCKLGELNGDELDPRRSGVYFRIERDLTERTDQLGVEIRERLTWDVREGIVGAETFEPRHTVIVTWKNVTFAGGTIHARKTTNTFQLVLATDETRTYAIYNYKHLGWTTHTEAGGSSEDGTGGIPAYVGFNAGNGTRAFEYKPYSQSTQILDLLYNGKVNNHPGRHIFRIDENILPGQCNTGTYEYRQELTISPESGNMLGGTTVNVTGPCFEPSKNIYCYFDRVRVAGVVIDRNRASCIMPQLYTAGYINLQVEIEDGNGILWTGKFFVETPSTASELVKFPNNEHLDKEPEQIQINWDVRNLTVDQTKPVSLSLWGYRENATSGPEIVFLDTLVQNVPNSGEFVLELDVINRTLADWMLEFEVGIVSVNITHSSLDLGNGPVLWSRPLPLTWYLWPSLKDKHGPSWTENVCENWIEQDRLMGNFTIDLSTCPCNLEQALRDKGRFLPDPNCDKDKGPRSCQLHENAEHCVLSPMTTSTGASQQCCYDWNGLLMKNTDNKWGGRPGRAHDYGQRPWNQDFKVPSLSHHLHDLVPFLPCCYWDQGNSNGCNAFRLEHRPSDTCEGYQAPSIGSVYGNPPNVTTFDGLPYQFVAVGEFVLARTTTDTFTLNIEGKFEEIPEYHFGEVILKPAGLTAVVAKENQTATVEVRLRPKDAQWRYRLDVFVDGRRVYFDRPSKKVQTFPGVTVYTPTTILNQSQVISMFQSGAGVMVMESNGVLTTEVYLPVPYLNQTRGLLGGPQTAGCT